MQTELTWQAAKSKTQRMELEIAELIPAEQVVTIEQPPTGMLLSCRNNQKNWIGSTTITMVPGAQIAPIVEAIGAHYTGSRFQVDTGKDAFGYSQVTLTSPETAEIYIVSEDVVLPGSIRIASGSACFTLPEGIYPGGAF